MLKKRLKSFILILLLMFSMIVFTAMQTAKGITYVDGHITKNTTWKLADHPYRIVNDVIVDSGVLLTIEPGVEVQVADGFSLVIEGSLHAVGTEVAQIHFTSSRSSPSPGNWETIKFEGNSSEQFTLKNVKVEYAVHAVTVNGLGLAKIEENYLSNCSESGINILGTNDVLIKNNIITQNKNGISGNATSYSGVTYILSGITAQYNEIESNKEGGVSLLCSMSDVWSSSSGIIQNITFSSNKILSNGGHGFYLSNNGVRGSNISDISLYSNEVSLNGKVGIYIDSYSYNGFSNLSRFLIDQNTVTQNTENGILVDSWARGSGDDSSVDEIAITSNTVLSNGGDGISLCSKTDTSSSDWYYPYYAYMRNITIESNTASLNGGNGVYLLCEAYRTALIENVFFSSNTLVENSGHGVYVDNTDYRGKRLNVHNLTFAFNTVTSNTMNGIYLYTLELKNITFASNIVNTNQLNGIYAVSSGSSSEDSFFDTLMFNNTVTANEKNGIWISGGGNVNMTKNSISHNGENGVLFSSAKNNLASYNNINLNKLMGMNVTNDGTVIAESNYWGHATGPYHISLNPEGLGNPVGGQGTDLDFIPFLSSPVEGIAYDVSPPSPSPTPSPLASPSPSPTETPSSSPTATASPSPTSSPEIPEFPYFMIFLSLIGVTLIGALIFKRKQYNKAV